MSKESIICPNCNEFIGERGELSVCPCCGYNLVDEDESVD